MNNNDKGFVDKFLDGYDKYNSKNVELVKVYVKPTKIRSLFGFIFSLIFFIILITVFTLNLMYFILLFGSLAIVIYYGINLFTEKGIGLPRTVEVPVKEEINRNDNELNHNKSSDRYRVQ